MKKLGVHFFLYVFGLWLFAAVGTTFSEQPAVVPQGHLYGHSQVHRREAGTGLFSDRNTTPADVHIHHHELFIEDSDGNTSIKIFLLTGLALTNILPEYRPTFPHQHSPSGSLHSPRYILFMAYLI